MEQFLIELNELLIKHKAAIVRSASDTHNLVVCVGDLDAEFEEDITYLSFKNKDYVITNQVSAFELDA